MKKILTFFAVLLLAVTVWAQNPKLTYQAVVRDNANMLVTNSTVDVTISVLRTDNSLQYTQSFDNVPTNQNGLFTLFFGGENDWDNVNWIHSKIAVAITLPDRSVVKDTTDVNAVPLAISTINSGTSGPSTQVQSDWAQTDQYAPSFIQNKPEIGDSVNTILVNGQYVTITMMDGRHYLTSDSAVIVNMRNNISNNTTNIAANTTNISNNTANISNNTTNIATNIANIAANTTNISNNTTNIATNTANIAANTTNISNNTANINNLILHTKKAAIRDSVAGQIHDSIAAIGATITQNHTHANMSVLNATTAPFTTANKTTLDSLAAAGAEQNVQANWNETNAANDAFIRNKPSITDTVNTILANRNFVTNTIMDGRHYLTSDSIVIVNMRNNISNNTTNIISNTTNIEANTTNINNNTTKIETNITNIAANTTNISNNTTNITNNTANIATNRTNIATNTTNINNNTANITANTTNINNLILHTKKAAIRDSVAGQIHDSIAANNLVTINNNQTISGDKTFTGTTIVPSGFTLGATTASNCNNVAVNACDLLAVFDSIQRRMDNLESVIEDLREEVANLRDTVRILRGDSVPTVTVSLPSVTTLPVTDITETTAICGGNVTADGGASVTARGVCWSTDANPTISGSHTTDGTGTGSFTSTITDLTAGTTYHVRAYATNSEGTAYGEEVSFTTQKSSYSDCGPLPCPAPATSMIVDTVYQFDSILYNGLHFEYDSDGHIIGASQYKGTELAIKCGWIYKFNVVAGGIYEWNTDVSHGRVATIGDVLRTRITLFYDDFQTYATASQSAVNTEVDGCEAAGLAWKANYTGTVGVMVTRGDQGIGSDDDFCACNNDPLLLRYNQLKYPDPDNRYFIVWGRYGITDTLPCDDRAHYIYDSGSNAMRENAGGNYSNNENGYLVLYPEDIRSKLKLWGQCKLQDGDTLFIYNGDYSQNQNLIAFEIITGQQHELGNEENPIFMSQIAGNPISLRMKSDSSCTLSGFELRAKCFPVTVTLPTVTTSSATNITETSATSGGNVTADGGASVTARGVCWSTDANPTIEGSHTTDGTGTGSFTSTITGLTAGTTYHVRAYATNSEGTAYGEEVSFTTQNTTPVTPVDGQPCPGAATVTDHQGNVYNTVQIGEQCWTRENMRCTTSPSTGTTILEASPTSYSHTGKKAYYVDGNSSNTSTYGLLYNWNAAVDTFNTAYGETSTNTSSSNAVSVTFSGKRRGICPQGWHVPSDAEWTQLTTYVKSQPDYVCSGCSGTDDGNYTHCIAKALASATGWTSYTGTASGRDCYPCYAPSSNNAAGFSALPAGYYNGSSFYNVGSNADFWSSTPNGSYGAYARDFRYVSEYVYRDYYTRFNGISVRCLRD